MGNLSEETYACMSSARSLDVRTIWESMVLRRQSGAKVLYGSACRACLGDPC